MEASAIADAASLETGFSNALSSKGPDRFHLAAREHLFYVAARLWGGRGVPFYLSVVHDPVRKYIVPFSVSESNDRRGRVVDAPP